MEQLLDGLRLYQPQTFLFPSNYALALSRQTATAAAITLSLGVFLVFFGLPLRRITAALLGAGSFWVIGGVIAMSQHWPFAVFAVGFATLGLTLGFLLPRLTLAFITAILLAVCMRALGIALDIPVAKEMPFELFSGSFAVMFIIGFIAWFSWIALTNALIGAMLIVYSLPPLLGGVQLGHVITGAALALLAFIGLVVQVRQGIRPRPQWMQRRKARV